MVIDDILEIQTSNYKIRNYSYSCYDTQRKIYFLKKLLIHRRKEEDCD